MDNKKKITIIILSGLFIIGIIIVGLFLYVNGHKNIDNTNAPTVIEDSTAPTLTLLAESNDNGDYYINLIRETETDSFDPMSLIDTVSDDTSIADNIIIECNDVLDISKSTQYISYIITDESGNSTTVKLLIMYSDDPDKVREEQQSQIAEMEEEIAKLEAEEQARLEEEERRRKEAEEAAKQEQANNKPATPTQEPAKPSQPEPKPQVQAYHNVNNFTISGTGNLQADLQNGAMANCSYGGCNGILGAYSFDMNGNTVTIHWTCTCGWTGTSIATIQ